MNPLAKIRTALKSFWSGAGEGQYRDAYGWSELGNRWLLDPLDGTGWQRNLTTTARHGIAAVQAAVALHINALTAMMLEHFREDDKGGFFKVKSSAFTRWIRRPNGWQTLAEWFAEGERTLLESGNAVGYMVRNDRTEITEIIWATHWAVHIEPQTGAFFYTIQMPPQYGEWNVERMVPQRDILHMRINVDGRRDPLRGRSPLEWCAAALATNATLSAFLVAWLNNRASPSYVLSTDLTLTADQMKQLRSAWAEQAQGMKSGGVPILAGGLKPMPMGIAPGDALLVDTFNLTVEDIARAFSLPKALLGVDETASNALALMRQWVSHGLGSHIELWEQAMERAFEFSAAEHAEFDTHALLRLSPNEEATRLKELVTGGILSLDEARESLRMMPVDGGYGRMPALQQQMTPVNLLAELHASEIAAKNTPAPQPQPAQPEDDANKSADPEITKALVVSILANKRKTA